MTDNRTTELLRKLLDERGVEYLTDDDERAYDEPMRTTWDFVLCGYEMTVTATEFVDIEGKTYLEMDFHHAFTPEQAVAATLGSERIEELEELIRIMWLYLSDSETEFPCCIPVCESLREDMRALGLEVRQ